MRKPALGFGCALILVLCLPALVRAEDFYVAIGLYRSGPGPEDVLSSMGNSVSIYPFFESRAVFANSSASANAGLLGDLMRIYGLDSVTSVFEQTTAWNKAMGALPGVLVFEENVFQLDLRPKVLAPDKIQMRVLLSRARRTAAGPEHILDATLIATIDDPVVAGFSYRNQRYYLSFRVSKKPVVTEAGDRRVSIGGKETPRIPLPIKRVPPEIPKDLERADVEGEVVLRVTVGPKGTVTDVQVLQSLDPGVDKATTQALRQWTFEKASTKGGARPSSFVMSFRYRPGGAWDLGSDLEENADSSRPAVEPVSGNPKELDRILASCAAYCDRLSAAVLDFVCEEKIDEEIYEYYMDPGRDYISATLKKRTEKNAFLYDYQMIRTTAGIREDRTLLEDNGRKTREAHAALKTKRFFSYQSIYGPIGFFARDRQSLFDYALAGRDTYNGADVWVVEVKPKGGLGNLPSGKAWVGPDSGQILKIERDAESLEGYGQVLRTYDLTKVKPQFITEHYYETAKNGILFPSKTTFRESIRGQSGRRFQISKTEIAFAKYRFFTVQIEASVIKRAPETER